MRLNAAADGCDMKPGFKNARLRFKDLTFIGDCLADNAINNGNGEEGGGAEGWGE